MIASSLRHRKLSPSQRRELPVGHSAARGRAAIPTSNIVFSVVLAALAASLLCMDFFAGLGLVALGAMFLLLRGSGDPGILMFCLWYQWLFIVTGFIYQDLFGVYPGELPTRSLGAAVTLMLCSLIALAAGLRTGMMCCERLTGSLRALQTAKPVNYDVNKLFWLVIILFMGSWLTNTTSQQVAYSISQILLAALMFRFVFLYMLFLMVVRYGQGYGRGVVALAFALAPSFASGMSKFKEFLFLLLLAMLTEIAQQYGTIKLNHRLKRICLSAACLAVAFVPLGLIWNGAIKPAWRPQVQGGQRMEGSKLVILGNFVTTAIDAVAETDWVKSVESSAGRFSNAPYLFSLVLDRVPSQVPYEDGSLTWRGIRHILTPRFLFPDKVNLGSDSWLVRKYAGAGAAGEESNTSIGLSYLTEFYIDFGPVGMSIAAFCFGCALGAVYRGLALVAPSLPFFTGSAVTVAISAFMGLESNFAKLLGTLIMALVVFSLLLKLCGPALHRVLARPAAPRRQPAARTRPVNKAI